MNILFIDITAYKPYSLDMVYNESLGGSEATMLRIASGLAHSGHSCYLYQSIASEMDTQEIGGIAHIGMNSEFPAPDLVVHFRMPTDIKLWKSIYPDAKHIMWLQDLGGEWLKEHDYDQETPIVCTSKFHVLQVNNELRALGLKAPSVKHVYNPVCVTYAGSSMPKIPARLGFFSSPHKGLIRTIEVFSKLRLKRPDLELVVGNPGYIQGIPEEEIEGVRFLGDLPHFRAMEELGQCAMLFYPQVNFPEAFGIVMGEANALGVPVLAHRFGASKEVCALSDRVIDCKDDDNVIDSAIELLGSNNPREIKECFKIENVLKAWEGYLEETFVP